MNIRNRLIQQSGVHPEWEGILLTCLEAVDSVYLDNLCNSNSWLPGAQNLFSAFRRNLTGVEYILIGESPYPRAQSANGIAFYDAAVGSLWSDTGLSKQVNRATSLRNIVKTALIAEGYLQPDANGKITQASIASVNKIPLIESLFELFQNFENAGFLMLNATPVLHPDRKPIIEATYWREFLATLLEQLAEQKMHDVTLVLWGKIANSIESMGASGKYQKIISEHPYNLSFIDNPDVRALFRQLAVISKRQ